MPIAKALIDLVARDDLSPQMKRVEGVMKRVRDRMNGVARAARRMLLVGGGAIAGFVKLASDAEEVSNRFRQVFKEQAGAAEEFAVAFAQAIGRSRGTIRKSLATYQSFFVGLGFGGDQAFEMSKRMQELAVDFASFNNISDDEALQRFISALSGSAEVLDRFGINIKAAALDQELMRSGLQVTAQSATEQQKAIARLNIILRAMTDQGAVGDALRTGESFANQLKAMRGAMKDLGVELGGIFIPHVLRLIERIRELLPAIMQWVKQNHDLILSWTKTAAIIAGVVASLPTLANAMIVASTATRGLIAAARGLKLALAGVKAGMVALGGGVVAAAIAAATAGLAAIAEHIHTLIRGFDELQAKIDSVQGRASDLFQDLQDANRDLEGAESSHQRVAALERVLMIERGLVDAINNRADAESNLADEQVSWLEKVFAPNAEANQLRLQQLDDIEKRRERQTKGLREQIRLHKEQLKQAKQAAREAQNLGGGFDLLGLSGVNSKFMGGTKNTLQLLADAIRGELASTLENEESAMRRSLMTAEERLQIELQRLAALRAAGKITDAEFQKFRGRILAKRQQAADSAGFMPPAIEGLTQTFRRIQEAALENSRRANSPAKQTATNTKQMAATLQQVKSAIGRMLDFFTTGGLDRTGVFGL